MRHKALHEALHNVQLKPALVWGAVLGVLSAVFMLYTNPDFIVDTANQVWFCFQ